MTSEHEEPGLSEKEMEIIAVGASVASGCLPCTKFHLRAAAGSGAAADDILEAVRDATRVRMEATEIMARAGGMPPAEIAQTIPRADSSGSLIRHLVSVGAAYTISCSTSLETHIGAARALGATNRQIFAALEIACRIRDVANQKAKSVAGAAMGQTDDETSPCDCAEGDPACADSGPECGPDDPRRAGGEPCSCGGDSSPAPKR